MKKFIAIGLGNFGLSTAATLVENGCEVLGIDSNREAVELAKEHISHVVVGDASKKEVLESLMLKDFDGAIVSIGQEMAPSILISLYLKEIGVPAIVVRAVTEDHGKILKLIGVTTVVFPEKEMGVRLAKRLALKNALDYLPLGAEYGILEVNPPAEFLGKTLRELNLTSNYNCQVIGMKSFSGTDRDHLTDSGSTITLPTADDLITESTVMIIIGKWEDINVIQKM